MSIPRTPPPPRPTGGRGPSTKPKRQPKPELEPEDSRHPELGESPTILRVAATQDDRTTDQEPPASTIFDEPSKNPYLPQTNPEPLTERGPLPDTKADAEAKYTSHLDTRATVLFESPPRLPRKLESPPPKDEPISPVWPSPSWRATLLPKEPPTDEELFLIKDKMTKEWGRVWTDLQQAMGPEKAERFRTDVLETIGGANQENTIPPYQPRTFVNIGPIPPNPYARHTPAPSYRSPTPFLGPPKKPTPFPNPPPGPPPGAGGPPGGGVPRGGPPGGRPPGGGPGRPAVAGAGRRAAFRRGFWDITQGAWTASLTPGAGPNGSPKIATPEKYDGVSKGAKAEEFIAKCESYFRFKAHLFNDDADLIAWAVLLLSDRAWSWVQPILTNGNDIRAQNWAAFVYAFDLNFGEHDTEGRSKQKIHELKQTRSAADYTSEFNNLAVRIQWNDQALIDQYKRGLKTEIMKAGAIVPWPNTLPEVQERAVYMDDELFKARWLEGRAPNAPPQTRRPFATRLPANRTQTQTQATTTTNRQWQPRNKNPITDAQKKERRKKGLCLYCGKGGHFARNCPNKTNISTTQIQEESPPEDETNLDPFEEGKDEA
ncbi:hypothetical protein FRB90_009046, partial [Tulasnella sp. 427]